MRLCTTIQCYLLGAWEATYRPTLVIYCPKQAFLLVGFGRVTPVYCSRFPGGKVYCNTILFWVILFRYSTQYCKYLAIALKTCLGLCRLPLTIASLCRMFRKCTYIYLGPLWVWTALSHLTTVLVYYVYWARASIWLYSFSRLAKHVAAYRERRETD